MKPLAEYFKFLKPKSRAPTRVSASLIAHAHVIWKVSLIVLAALLVAALLFDGYVFLFYVQDIEHSVEVGEDGTVPDIKDGLLADARQILARRAERLKTLDANLPARNPFLEIGQKKK